MFQYVAEKRRFTSFCYGNASCTRTFQFQVFPLDFQLHVAFDDFDLFTALFAFLQQFWQRSYLFLLLTVLSFRKYKQGNENILREHDRLTCFPMGYFRTLLADRGRFAPPPPLSAKLLDRLSVPQQHLIAAGLNFLSMLHNFIWRWLLTSQVRSKVRFLPVISGFAGQSSRSRLKQSR